MSTLPGGQAAAPKSRQRLLFPVRQERSQHLSYISAQVRRPRASGTPKSQVQCSGSRGTDYRISSMCPPAFPLRCLHRGMLLVSALSNDSEQSHASEGLWPLPTGAKLIWTWISWHFFLCLSHLPGECYLTGMRVEHWVVTVSVRSSMLRQDGRRTGRGRVWPEGMPTLTRVWPAAPTAGQMADQGQLEWRGRGPRALEQACQEPAAPCPSAWPSMSLLCPVAAGCRWSLFQLSRESSRQKPGAGFTGCFFSLLCFKDCFRADVGMDEVRGSHNSEAGSSGDGGWWIRQLGKRTKVSKKSSQQSSSESCFTLFPDKVKY